MYLADTVQEKSAFLQALWKQLNPNPNLNPKEFSTIINIENGLQMSIFFNFFLQ